ncbi:RrF2 family transcriptional regulator [Defluviicoccus vanus]|uniref:Rrf2 family transcriptional regulator n=1 Tax=Defluviicoccus vanus TaxID=111831 RepID=A0A7H1N5I4_9PROT|nr:Rrf2 family transcriptional regulator [Defluviicoccus vanus]QNT70970.1 Rrf2 family transcriptional regulator [Defluviicoccus vanus]
MLSQKAKYALKALFQLATSPPGTMMLVADIAAKENAPKKFLELILLELKRDGIVYSLRGRNGGYALARPPGQVTVGQVVRLMDGPLAPIPCASLSAYRPCNDCKDEEFCPVRRVMREVRDAVAEILDNRTLADMTANAALHGLIKVGVT